MSDLWLDEIDLNNVKRVKNMKVKRPGMPVV